MGKYGKSMKIMCENTSWQINFGYFRAPISAKLKENSCAKKIWSKKHRMYSFRSRKIKCQKSLFIEWKDGVKKNKAIHHSYQWIFLKKNKNKKNKRKTFFLFFLCINSAYIFMLSFVLTMPQIFEKQSCQLVVSMLF